VRNTLKIALTALVLSAPTAAFAKGGHGGGGGWAANPAMEKIMTARAEAKCKQNAMYCNGDDGIKYWGASYGMVIPAAYK